MPDAASTPTSRERVGMRREAHFREHVRFKGRWASEYVYALLRHEWPPRPPSPPP
jgi:RimJ/RimL family protein N-acetyltransferase